MYIYVLLIIISLPLLGCLATGFWGRFVGREGSILLTLYPMVTASFLSTYHFLNLCSYKTTYFVGLTQWIVSDLICVNWGFMFDSLSLCLVQMILLVSTVVHVYSVNYMVNDPHLPRFMCYLSLFTFFMLFMVSSDNLTQLVLGWEGVGICSYLLINFWYTRIQANKSGLKAVFVNKIGDCCLVFALVLTLIYFRSTDFSVLFVLTAYFISSDVPILGHELGLVLIISWFLVIAVVCKSAQFGLHVWLVDAMEGATPVSALIHAATMVTAGVFLVVRCSCFFEHSDLILACISFIGGLTCFFASTTAVSQNDIKKVIAFSTCSQLGYMIFACGLSSYTSSIYHLINHAFFKALLFLTSGLVIHALQNEQDMRRLGGLAKILPCTYVFCMVGTLAIIGTPLLSGHYSKDNILEIAYITYGVSGVFTYLLGNCVVFFTSFYSIRLLMLSFLCGYRS